MTFFSMITTARSAEYTAPALDSFFRTTPFGAGDSFLLIDNDGSYELPVRFSERGISLHHNPAPRSFAGNGNLAAQQALSIGQELVLLNNDLIFTARWFEPFQTQREAVMVPHSNGEIAYNISIDAAGNEFRLSPRMSLADYTGHEAHLEQIAALHRERVSEASPLLPVMCSPFFAVRIPAAVLASVGGFDTRFGPGGAEDYDYAIRCHFTGYSVTVARRSYLLHFGSQSFGQQADSARAEREKRFTAAFREKWGERIYLLAFDDSPDALQRAGITDEEVARGDLKAIITRSIGAETPPLYLPFMTE